MRITGKTMAPLWLAVAALLLTVSARAADERQTYKIGFISWAISHTVPAAWAKGMQDYCDNFPNINLKVFDGEEKPETQARLMQDLINQNYDAIILQAADAAALASSVEEAEEMGIPVVCINLDTTVPHAGLVQMATYDAGYLAGEAMANQMNGQGKVVIIQGVIGASTSVLRESGFRAAIAKHPGIEILAAQPADWDKQKAMSVMNSFLQAYPQINGVFGINDSMAEGAALAAEAAGRLDGMYIWGDDGQKDTLAMIEDGRLAGTIYTNCFEQGAMAAALCTYIISSGIDVADIPNTGIINMAPIVVTKDNVHTILEKDRW
ncbi:MAG: sugar ABC transporter substrate-binding protein [Planctomycetes bacterium]|nr:sugar ABC transporter substrate-binding protein [Planctomycetota bacterium]